MINPRVASRYAKSLIVLAQEKDCLEVTLKDMQYLDAVCRQSRDFENMLRSPIIHSDKKKAAMHAVVGVHAGPFTKMFINLLINKGRESNLPEIATSFIEQYQEIKKIKRVKLTTAAAIDDSVRDVMVRKVEGFLPGFTIEMESSIDEKLIGGFVLEIGDNLYDASVKKALNEIRNNVIDTSFVSKM